MADRTSSSSGSGGPLGAGLTQGSQVLGMTAGPTIRAQLDSIAMTVHEVVGRVELSGRTIINLEEDRDRLKKVIESQDDILNQRILSECNNVRDDFNHKFALQVAENKRLQAQLAKSQVDVARLTRIIENLATRVQIIEANTGLA